MASGKRPGPGKTVRKAKDSRGKGKSAESQLEQGIEDFSKEVEDLGKRFSERFEKHADGKTGAAVKCECRPCDVFGIVGPLLSSVGKLVCLALLVWVLGLLNGALEIGLIDRVRYFLLSEMGWFFVIFLFFSYASYAARRIEGANRLVGPLSAAAGVTVAFWLIGNAVSIANVPIGNGTLSFIASFLTGNLWAFFLFFALIFYTLAFTGAAFCGEEGSGRCGWKGWQGVRGKGRFFDAKARPVPGRLYRSGKERILGGVCGGIAEHLGVDPVLIRILWIAACFAWGFGIVLYVICWIIIPRNPRDRWN